MIKNQKQAATVQKEIDDLRALLAEMDSISAEQKLDFKQQLQYNVWKGRIEDLKVEIEEYEHLTSGDLRVLEVNSDNLQKAIMSFRIASGLTQKDIADKLEIQEQQIQRYEQNDYLTASFERIIQILNTLEVEVTLKKEFKKQTKVIDINKFRLPKNRQNSVESSVKKVVERKQLMIG
jgi:transcriptional regulator with XRE-family HTH domain